ncbi:MAG: hypothetical protein K0U74_12465 [Alphaproteobacteria bacterium]|nr:hypothetical protein [Alphaproteobacteria bacterium]
MSLEWIPVIGTEGYVILSIIGIASLVLAGGRVSVAGPAGVSGQSRASRKTVPRRVIAAEASKTSANQISYSRNIMKAVSWIASGVGLALKAVLVWLPRNFFRVVSLLLRSALMGANPKARPSNAGALAVERELDDDMENGEKPLDEATQWSRINGVVDQGIDKARQIGDLHEAAARQLDAVDYAYERMLVELREILPNVSEAQIVCRSNRDAAYEQAAAVSLQANVDPELPVTAMAKDSCMADGSAFDDTMSAVGELEEVLKQVGETTPAHGDKADQSVAA